MTAPVNPGALAAGTGIAWDTWLRLLDPFSSENHARLAEEAQALIRAQGKSDNPAWWAQSVAVAYEQHLGRRVPGQQQDGSFAISLSRTLPGSPEKWLEQWQKLADARRTHREAAATGMPRVNRTAKWVYWRLALSDGTRVVFSIQPKPGNNAALTLRHERILSQGEAALWRNYWKECINAL